MLLNYILKGIPKDCTVSIVDLTEAKPICLCSNVKAYEPKKMYEVIRMQKEVIDVNVDYNISVIEWR